jgi:hypothetical protein
MNYKKIYDSLIERSKNRVIEGYFESHHIVPRCMGGGDEKENKAELTPEEHYLAHQLLVKIYPNERKLAFAAAMMIPNRPSNKFYGWLRRKHSEAMKEMNSGRGNPNYGKIWIYHELVGPRIIKKEFIVEYIEQGWCIGRTSKIPKPKKEISDKNRYSEYYTDLYRIYKDVGFEELVKITKYKFSKQNLVQMFSRHVKEFVPQNGKKIISNKSPL